MIFHAGSLYDNNLVLYPIEKTQKEGYILHFFEDSKFLKNLQWDIYCCDVEFQPLEEKLMGLSGVFGLIQWQGETYRLQYTVFDGTKSHAMSLCGWG